MKVSQLGGNNTAISSTNQEGEVAPLDRATIDANSTAAIMALLANIYTKPAHANVREYVSNAYDAHKEAGRTMPVRVHLPNPNRVGEGFFAVRDFGKGLTPTDISAVFKNYGTSTKRHSDGLIGGFGIGSKSAFALGIDGFQIRSITLKDGVKTLSTYNYFKDESGIPALEHLGDEVGTEEPTGLEIVIPVEGINQGSFVEAAYAYLPYFDPPPEVTNAEKVGYRVELASQYVSGTTFRPADGETDSVVKVVAPLINGGRRNSNLGAHSKFLVLLGNVPYPIDTASVARMLATKPSAKNDFEEIVSFFSAGLDIYAKIGSAEIAPTREALTYTVTNCLKIVEIFKAAKKIVDHQIDLDLKASNYDPSSLRYFILKSKLVSRFNTSVRLPINVQDVSVHTVSFNRSMAADIKPFGGVGPTVSAALGENLLDVLVPGSGKTYMKHVMFALEPAGAELPKPLLTRSIRRTLKIFDRNGSLPSSYFKHSHPTTNSLRQAGFFSRYCNAYSYDVSVLLMIFKEETDFYNELVSITSDINDGNALGVLSNLQPLLDDPSLLAEEKLSDNEEEDNLSNLSQAERAEREQKELAYANALRELKKKRARLKVLGLNTSEFFLQKHKRTSTDYWGEVEVDSSMKGYYVPIYRGNIDTTTHYIDPVYLGQELNKIARYLGMTQADCEATKIYGIKRAEIPKVSTKFPQLKPISDLFNELYRKAFAKIIKEVDDGSYKNLATVISAARTLASLSSPKLAHADLVASKTRFDKTHLKYQNLARLIDTLNTIKISVVSSVGLPSALSKFKDRLNNGPDSPLFNSLTALHGIDFDSDIDHDDGLEQILVGFLNSSVCRLVEFTLEDSHRDRFKEFLDGANALFEALCAEYDFLEWEISLAKNNYFGNSFSFMPIVFNRCLIEEGNHDKLFSLTK